MCHKIDLCFQNMKGSQIYKCWEKKSEQRKDEIFAKIATLQSFSFNIRYGF